MAGFKDKFTDSFGSIANIIPTKFLQIVSNQRIILPFYHAISNKEMPHIKHLYPVKRIEAFIKDLDFLLKHYAPIDYFEFQQLSHNNVQPKKPSFLLSFDDGLKEFHDVIAPILLKKGIPAVCFLNSGFIDNKDLFYRYKASLIINEIHKKPTAMGEIQNKFGASFNKPENILSTTYKDKKILNELASHIGISFNDFLNTHTPYLKRDQIESLIDQGFHFGAHSIDHPEYHKLDISEQLKQTRESIHDVCTMFSLDYKAFSFPFTDYRVTKKFFETINSAGVVDNTFGTAGQKSDVISNNFQRIPFEMANLTGKQILNSELLYYLLKMPLGRNKIYRND